jgi:exopolysaccharide biosynthesis glucuronosyltransferase PssE
VIFVTVGTDGPFDRLVQAIDRWAGEANREDVYAQIGRSTLQPRYIKYTAFLEPEAFAHHFRRATAIVSHAGMGTILSALQYSKPMLVMPRRAALGEQRNDHQLATARRLSQLGRITVAFDETELISQLDRIDALTACAQIGPFAQPELIAAIRSFIDASDENATLCKRLSSSRK